MRWAASGRELFYENAAGRIVGVELLPGATFAMGRRQNPLALETFQTGVRAWDIAPDGRRFLVMRRKTSAPDLKIVVVHNLLADLKTRMEKR